MFFDKIKIMRNSLCLFKKTYATKSDCEIFLLWLEKTINPYSNFKPFEYFCNEFIIKRKNKKLFDLEDCWELDLFSATDDRVYNNLIFGEEFQKDILNFKNFFFHTIEIVLQILNGRLVTQENLIHEIRNPKLFAEFKVEIKIPKEFSAIAKKNNKILCLYFCIYYRFFPEFKKNTAFRIVHLIGISEQVNFTEVSFEVKTRFQDILNEMNLIGKNFFQIFF